MMSKPGALQRQNSLNESKFSDTGRNSFRRRHASNTKPSRRGLWLLLLAAVCTLLITTRLLWCLFLNESKAKDTYIQRHSITLRRESVSHLDESEGQRRFRGEETVWTALGRRVYGDDDDEHEFTSNVVNNNSGDDVGRISDDDDDLVDGEGREDGEEGVNDQTQIDGETAEMENSESKDGDNSNVMEGEENFDSASDRDSSGEDEDAGEGEDRKRRVPDAISYLEQLAGNLTKEGTEQDNGPYHSRRIYESEYAAMKSSLRIFVYPHDSSDPFHLIFQPSITVPSGNYASEEYFHQALAQSSFVTKDPSKADFFFMPVSITKARLDKRINVEGLQQFCANYVTDMRSQWSYWNRSNGADHFYLSCHSIARTAMDGVPEVRQNAIQLLCPASYFLPYYITHKDASVPQIWPRPGEDPKEVFTIGQRSKLAFFAGALNSPVRQDLEAVWGNDDKIVIHKGRVPYPYSEALLTSKFCLHAKGFEVNTARLGDAMYYGCVPVVIANHYDLPFQDILDWSKFSLIVSSLDIALLKKTLEAVTPEQYAELHRHVLLARKHFQWHAPPEEHDAFHTVMYELWKRRHIVRCSVPL